jgi:hypothetical protein
VVIGGYAVNAYVLPRFSVDCDIVIREDELIKIALSLEKIRFEESKETQELSYTGNSKDLKKKYKKILGKHRPF